METETTATATQVAKEIGIDKSTLSKWRKRPDCPPLSEGAKAIKAWHDTTFMDRGPKLSLDDDEDDDYGALTLESLGVELPEGDDIDGLLARTQEREKTLFARLTAAEKYLTTNRNPKLAARLTALQNQHSAVSKIVAAIMNTKHEMEVRGKNYIPREAFEARLNLILGQIFAFIRCLPIRVNAYTEQEKKWCVKVAQKWQLFVADKLLTEIDIAALEKKQEEDFNAKDFSSQLEVLELQSGVALSRELEARKQAQKEAEANIAKEAAPK